MKGSFCIKIRRFCALLLILNSDLTSAKDWLFTPSFSIGEVYTDNLNLSEVNKQSAFVTQVIPGISVNKQSNRLNLNLNYKMQSLYNASSGENNIYHLFNYNSNYQVIKNKLFIDTRASNNQQSVNSNFQSNNNIIGRLNRTNITTYGISPSWKPHFNGYAFGDIRFDYDNISTDSGLASNATQSGANITLQTDKKFSKNLGLRFTHSNQDQERGGAGAVSFQNDEIESRYYHNNQFNIFGLIGYSENSYLSSSKSFVNGGYYTIGFQWLPKQHFSIEAGYGNNSYVTLGFTPSRQLTWIVTYRHRNIGTNLGSTWQTNINYETKNANVNINYQEDTTSSQATLLTQSYSAQTIYQQQRPNDISNQINFNIPTLSNDVYIRKRANATVQYNLSKSNLSAQFYDERRQFQNNGFKQEVKGVLGIWNWHLSSVMRVYISPLWQNTTSVISNDERKDIAIGLSQTIPVKLGRNGEFNALFEYRHSNQNSSLIGNGFDENRLTANLIMAF